MTDKKKSPLQAGRGGRTQGARNLTPAQKAEAAALWRAGEATLDDLAKRFGKRPETFSRLFKEMGIQKGEAAKEHQAKVAAQVESRILQDAEALAARIGRIKEQHLAASNSIAVLVMTEIRKAREANKSLETLKGTMQALQLAAATLAKVREEAYAILRIEEHDSKVDDDELPDLTVRELTQQEIGQLQAAPAEDEMGAGLEEIPLDDDDDGVVEEGPSNVPSPGAGAR